MISNKHSLTHFQSALFEARKIHLAYHNTFRTDTRRNFFLERYKQFMRTSEEDEQDSLNELDLLRDDMNSRVRRINLRLLQVKLLASADEEWAVEEVEGFKVEMVAWSEDLNDFVHWANWGQHALTEELLSRGGQIHHLVISNH